MRSESRALETKDDGEVDIVNLGATNQSFSSSATNLAAQIANAAFADAEAAAAAEAQAKAKAIEDARIQAEEEARPSARAKQKEEGRPSARVFGGV